MPGLWPRCLDLGQGNCRKRGPRGMHRNLQSPCERTNSLSSSARPMRALLFKYPPGPDSMKPLSQGELTLYSHLTHVRPRKREIAAPCGGKAGGEQKREKNSAFFSTAVLQLESAPSCEERRSNSSSNFGCYSALQMPVTKVRPCLKLQVAESHLR